MEDNQIERIYCNTCKLYTRHEKVYNQRIEDKIGDINTFYQDVYVWKCMGCETVTFGIAYFNEKNLDTNGNMKKDIFYFPYRQSQQILPKRFINLPSQLDNLYNEIIITFNNWCLILASIGLRSLLEGICKDKEIQGFNLEKKIDNMDFISNSIKRNLHGIRFLGNSAAHELDSLSREEILIAIEIMEDVMNYTYELDYKSSRILHIVNEKQQLKHQSIQVNNDNVE